MISILCEFLNQFQCTQTSSAFNCELFQVLHLPKHDFLHGNYCSPHMGNHPECHLEFLKVFNGDKMTSIRVLDVNKNATKLFGLRNSLVLKSPPLNNVIFLILAAILNALHTMSAFLSLFQ